MYKGRRYYDVVGIFVMEKIPVTIVFLESTKKIMIREVVCFYRNTTPFSSGKVYSSYFTKLIL